MALCVGGRIRLGVGVVTSSIELQAVGSGLALQPEGFAKHNTNFCRSTALYCTDAACRCLTNCDSQPAPLYRYPNQTAVLADISKQHWKSCRTRLTYKLIKNCHQAVRGKHIHCVALFRLLNDRRSPSSGSRNWVLLAGNETPPGGV